MEDNIEIAISTQQKFDFYFLALVFTVLGLSIQTSEFSYNEQSYFEIAGWILLFISGLAGLFRMEWRPLAYEQYSHIDADQSLLRDLKSGATSGRILSSEDVGRSITVVEERIKERYQVAKSIEIKDRIKYFLHKWLFVFGVALLIISRVMSFYSSSPKNVSPEPNLELRQTFINAYC